MSHRTDPVRTDTQAMDVEEPLEGEAFSYLVSADDGTREGTLGLATGAVRSNFTPCP